MRIKFLLIIIFIPILSACRNVEAKSTNIDYSSPVFVYWSNDKFGLANLAGQIIVPPTYEGIYSDGNTFINNLATFTVEEDGSEYQGVLNARGEIYLEPVYDSVYIQDNFIMIEKDGSVGLLDISLNEIVPTIYQDLGRFKEGLASIQVDGNTGFINEQGELVINPVFESASEFSEGLAYITESELYGFIDKNGNVVIEPQFLRASGFTEGLASVTVLIDGTEKTGFIDKSGAMVIEPKFESGVGWFANGLAEVEIDGLFGLIDKTGKFVVQPFSEDFINHEWMEGPFEVYVGNSCGYKNLKDSLVIPQIYSSCWPFFEGIAAVRDSTMLCGYIDTRGNYLAEPKFFECGRFTEGLAAVNIDDERFAFINTKGDIVFELNDKISNFTGRPPHFTDGIVRIRYHGGNRVILDKTGTQLFSWTE